jgi:ribosomal protein S18 acetylase RimI-like enzyme
MPSGAGAIGYRAATPHDANAIAALHADSWRRNYRGAYADSYLDGDVLSDRRRVWAERLAANAGTTRTIVAYTEGQLAGFTHVVLDDDPVWGALLDNLHVTYDHRRRGIGAGLMVRVARAVVQARPGSRLYLWVLEQNQPAQAFYESLRGQCVERKLVPPPGGDPTRLTGTPTGLRYVWSDPALLFQPG